MYAAAPLFLLFAAVMASNQIQPNSTNFKDNSPNFTQVEPKSNVRTDYKNLTQELTRNWKELLKTFPSNLKTNILLELLNSYSGKDLKKILETRGLRLGPNKITNGNAKNITQSQSQNKKGITSSGVTIKNITVTRGNETSNLKGKKSPKFFTKMTVKLQKDHIKKLLRDNLGINVKNIIFSPRKYPTQTQPARKPNTRNKHSRIIKRNRLNHSTIANGKKLKKPQPSTSEHLNGNQIVNYYIINGQTDRDKLYYDDGYNTPHQSSTKRLKKPALKKQLSKKIKKLVIPLTKPTTRKPTNPAITISKLKRTRKPTVKNITKEIKIPTPKKTPTSPPNEPASRELIYLPPLNPSTNITRNPTATKTIKDTRITKNPPLSSTEPTTSTTKPPTEPLTGITNKPTVGSKTISMIEPTTELTTGPTTDPRADPISEPMTKSPITEPPSIQWVQPLSLHPNYVPLSHPGPSNGSPNNFPFEVYIKMDPQQFNRQRRRKNHNAALKNVLFSNILTNLKRNPLTIF